MLDCNFVAVPKYIDFLGRRLTGGDLKSARIAKYAVETAIKELEYKQKTGELVERAAVNAERFKTGREVREGCDNLAPRLAGLVAAESDQHKCFELIKQEVHQVLEALCDQATTNHPTRPRPAARRDPRDPVRPRGSA
jgi:hypothetical protein